MSRGRSVAQKAADTARHSGWAALLELQFASGTLRLAVGPYDITVGADTYTATGALLSVDAMGEAVDGTEGLSFALSGCASGIFDLVVNEPYKDRVIRLLEQRYDADHQAVDAPSVEWVGRMQVMTSTEHPRQRSHTVVIQAEHYDAQARRPVNLRFSDAEQRRRYPDDKGAEYVTSLTERVLARKPKT